MNKLFCLIFCAVALVTSAQEKTHLEVNARGIGTTPDMALKDALSQAVQQAAGTIVDAKTLVENENVVEDKILTASDGFIRSYEKYGEPRQNRHGLWTIKIKATVVMKPLKQKLQETGILVQDVGNSAQNQWAEIVSKQSVQQDVPAMLENLIKKYPVESMLNAYVFDDKGRFENLKLYFPQKGYVRDGNVQVSMGVVVVADIEKYQKHFLPELQFLLDKIAPEKGSSFFVRGNRSEDIGFSLSPSDGCITTGKYQGSWKTLFPAGECERESINLLWGGNDYRLAVNITQGKYRANIQKFQIYTFSENSHLAKIFDKYFPQSLRKLKVRLSFTDKNNNVIFYKDKELNYYSGIYREYGNSYMITPEMSHCGSSSNKFFAANIVPFDCVIPLDDLKEITKVSASIVKE